MNVEPAVAIMAISPARTGSVAATLRAAWLHSRIPLATDPVLNSTPPRIRSRSGLDLAPAGNPVEIGGRADIAPGAAPLFGQVPRPDGLPGEPGGGGAPES